MKTILITGTSRGIGNYLTSYYLDKGFEVIGCSRNSPSIINSNYQHYSLDISDEIAIKKMFSNIPKLDILINNAGIASMNSAILNSLDKVKSVLNTNFIGTFLMCREAVKIMIKNRFGRIVNFSTIAVPLNLPGEAVYAASKSAIETFTRVLAKEVGKFNITVNNIGPSAIYTDLLNTLPIEKIQKILDLQVINKLASYDDISNVIDFYIDERSSFITGQTMYLGGIM